MSAHGKDDQAQPDDVRDMLRQLASQIKDQIADVDRRHNAALKTMEQRLQPGAPAFDEPWDADSAEALTRLYEGDAPQPVAAPAAKAVAPVLVEKAAKPLTAALPPKAAPSSAAPAQPIYFADPPVSNMAPAKPPLIAASAMPAAAQPLAAMASAMAAPSLATDRAWLDARLADLQSKVEASLAGFDPAPMLQPINARIDAFEGQMLGVLETVAQKADLERFATIETDMAAVKGHVEAARGQLKRLDGIEEQLRALHAVANEAQQSELPNGQALDDNSNKRLEDIEVMLRDLHAFAAEQQSAPAAEMPDFHGLAEKAADRAAANIVEQHMDIFSPAKRADMHAQALASNGASVEDVQSLLETYAEEHRREQSQTSAALTTMQEALIRLIDRIEELAGEAPQEAHDEQAPGQDAPRFVEVADERTPAPGRRQSDKVMTDAQQAQAAALAMAEARAQAAAAQAQAQAQVQAQPTAPPRAAGVRAPRMADPAQPPAVEDDAAAAQALAAERARVMAERAPGRRPPTARPQVQVASDDADATTADAPMRQPRKAKAAKYSKLQVGLAAGLAGALMIGTAVIAFPMFGKRVAETKMDQRLPKATTPVGNPAATAGQAGQAQPGQASTPTPSPAAQPAPAARPTGGRPVIPTEPLDAPAGVRATPVIPETLPSAPQRAQPTSGAALPVQPPPRDAPAPQVAPQGRAVETPAAPAQQQRRRPVPETVTDDLSSNTQQPSDTAQPSFAEVMGARVSTAALQGIALDSSSMPDPAELARRHARLAPAVSEANVESQAEALARGRPDMPPAQIGPMSLRMAAQKGDPSAAFEVAARYAEAKGVKQDFQQALVWYSRAAQQGFVPAQYRLATIYEGGLHGTQDLPRAKVWYKRAAEQGNVKAMHNLAVLAAGNGQSQPDYQTAAKWFSEAADRGLADSQFNLGVLHESGLGVQKDGQQAYKWFALAARSGDKEAIRRRDQLMASFTPQHAQTAEKLVQAWRAKPTDLKANDPRSASLAWQEQQGRLAQQAFERMEQQQAQQQPADAAPVAAEPMVKATKVPQRTTASVPAR